MPIKTAIVAAKTGVSLAITAYTLVRASQGIYWLVRDWTDVLTGKEPMSDV